MASASAQDAGRQGREYVCDPCLLPKATVIALPREIAVSQRKTAWQCVIIFRIHDTGRHLQHIANREDTRRLRCALSSSPIFLVQQLRAHVKRSAALPSTRLPGSEILSRSRERITCHISSASTAKLPGEIEPSTDVFSTSHLTLSVRSGQHNGHLHLPLPRHCHSAKDIGSMDDCRHLMRDST